MADLPEDGLRTSRTASSWRLILPTLWRRCPGAIGS